MSTQTRNPKHLLVRSPSDTVNMKKVCITLACIETRVNNRIKLINYLSTSTAEGYFFSISRISSPQGHHQSKLSGGVGPNAFTAGFRSMVMGGESWDQRLYPAASHGNSWPDHLLSGAMLSFVGSLHV